MLIKSNVLWPGSIHRQWWLDVLSAAVSSVEMEKCQSRDLASYFLKGAAAPHSKGLRAVISTSSFYAEALWVTTGKAMPE